jgi:hypothetical protein
VDPVLGVWFTVIVLCRTVAVRLTELAKAACVVFTEHSRRATLIAIVQALPEGNIALEAVPGGGKVLVACSQSACGAEHTAKR